MTVAPPAYFEPVRQKAARRWQQLEADPELAGPWHQLFKQVQRPRHILSELLQNADDAGATEAAARIENDTFVFEHNGEDFTEGHFASLCRFGYSNKRALHTIGFRGIGFKSTFSLGDEVELRTPTLAVRFGCDRFTEPHWLGDPLVSGQQTSIRAPIKDRHRRGEVEKNLQEWLKSPVSLLFFKNVREMRIGDQSVHWGNLGRGPVDESEWMALHENEEEAFLVLRSELQPFPQVALDEIRQERMLALDEETEFPPCRVEILLGAKGRLYVVLPTGVETALPFACNAPFIQDPARETIKDPETSPTNRWLLERVGRLAATAMLGWLQKSDLSDVDRAAAYGLFPDVNREDNSLEGVCATIVEEAFADAIEGQDLLLTDEGALVPAESCVIIPNEILGVWPVEQAAKHFDEKGRTAFSRRVRDEDKQKLKNWGLVEEVEKDNVLAVLRRKHLPRPETWRQLMALWAYVAPEITGYRSYYDKGETLCIVPVQSKGVLYPAREVVRIGEKKLLQSEHDWEFLSEHLIVLNQNWPRFLAQQRRVGDGKDDAGNVGVEAAYSVLERVGLSETSDVNKVVDQVSSEFFSQEDVNLAGCVQLAQIAAKLRAAVGDSFRYVSRSLKLRSASHTVLFDPDGKLEDLLPENRRERLLLHPDYFENLASCTREEWLQWVSSGVSGLQTFVPIVGGRTSLGRNAALEKELERRGFRGGYDPRYKDPWFHIQDWDFETDCLTYWGELEEEDPEIWCRVVDRILAERPAFWNSKSHATVIEEASNGHEKPLIRRGVLPSWVLRLRDKPCLPDTRGVPRRPYDLLRRTPETEPVMDVEPFVHRLADRESTQGLLDLLGVRDKPAGSEQLLDRLRALSKAGEPPTREVEKWYRRLDQMTDSCSTLELHNIRQAFRSEKLILTADGTWVNTTGVFLSSNEEDAPNAAIIRASVSDLSLWHRVGIAERPTAELAINWLNDLPSGQALPSDEVRRVRALLARYPVRVWRECGHWLNLAGEWVSTEDLAYGVSMQSLVSWRHLDQWVKQATADLTRLPGTVTADPPFSALPPLASHVEERFHQEPLFAGQPENREWLTTLGTELRRVELETDEDTRIVRAAAEKLAKTRWRTTPGLEILPYIDGTPAGIARKTDVLWSGEELYVDDLPKAKLARRVPEEIGRVFDRADIKAALDYSFERSPEDVRDYLAENFTLCDAENVTEDEGDERNVTASGDDTPTPASAADEKTTTETHLDDDAAPDVIDTAGPGSEVQPNDDATPEEEDGLTGNDEWVTRPRPRHRPSRPSLMERFAQAQGFRKDDDERYFHEDGSWIGRTGGSSFPWERHSRSGEFVCYYMPIDHCLEREPLELEADIWKLIKDKPEAYSLVLINVDGGPVEVTGAALHAMCAEGKITLFPATYRLVYEDDKAA